MRTLQGILLISRTMVLLLAASTAIMFAAGCASTKNLTPSSARRLIQDRIEADGRQTAMLPYASSFGFFLARRTNEDYAQNIFPDNSPKGILHRLLRDGFVQQKVETVSFPNLTGSYDGQKKRDFHPITLVLHPETSEVSGTYNYDGCTGTITGNLEPNGGVYLRFHSAVHYVCLVPKDGPGPWRIQPVSNGGFDLVGPTTVVHGTGSSGTIAMTVYTYLPTSKLDAFRTSDRMIKIGKVAVDNVTDLLLETEVSASGKYVWHIDYNELGRELKGTNASRSHGDVKFQKQPDGAWTCTWWYQ